MRNQLVLRCLAPVLILLLATGLRFYRLDAQSFWNDEGNAARAAERPVPLILEAAAGDIHPPGYYLLLHFWRALVGESEFALRALSAFCSVTAVAFTYSLGRRLLGKAVGLGGGLLAALSPLSVYYSQEARMYALLGLFSVASTYFLCSMFRVRRSGAQSAARLLPFAYVLAAAAGLYTHYAFPFVLAVHTLLFLAWWMRQRWAGGERWRILLGWLGLQGAVVVLFLPWLPTAWRAVTGWPPAGRGYRLGMALLDIFHVLTAGITVEAEEVRWALILAGGLFLAGLWPRRGRVGVVAAPAIWLLLPIALIFAFDLYKPAYLKFLLAVLPPFHLLLAQGVERLVSPIPSRFSPILRPLVYGALLVGALFPSLRNLYTNPAYARDDYRQIAADIAAWAHPGDGIILNAPNQWEVFTYYHRDGAPVYPIPHSRPPRPEAVEAELQQIAADHRRLFVLYWGDAEADPQRLVERWLAAHAYPAGDRWYGRVRLSIYGVGPLPEEPAVSQDARFGETIHLWGWALDEGPFAPGEVVPVTLFWEAGAAIPERYKVFLHLLDSQGSLVAQTDAEPGGNLRPTTIWTPGERMADRHGVLLPPDLPPGEYVLLVGLYRFDGGARLPVEAGDGFFGDSLTLGRVVVSSR